MKRAFTLIEVNLAMLIMAGGILSLVGLYSFGFRESKQSREDVESAALADAFVSPLVMAISATNLTWSKFKKVPNFPNDQGWGAFLNSDGRITREPDGETQFGKVIGAYSACAQGGDTVTYGTPATKNLKCALVVMRGSDDRPDSPIVRIGFRATKSKEQLMSMPLYYTEVRFQGIIDQ